MSTATTNDCGEAILEAFRNLGVDYVISSPGSEWAPVWEALARQKVNETPGPQYINCWHETLAVNMASGYTRVTGRMQAVLLHAGVGLLQGSMGVHGAMIGEVPMLVCSGEATSYGEDPEIDPQGQWYRNLSVVGGPDRFADAFTKWSGRATSPHTVYEQVVRAGELAQRVPQGPSFMNIPIETMVHSWTPPEKLRTVPSAPKIRPSDNDIAELAELIARSRSPLIVTDSAGREVAGFNNLVALAELFAIPVVESNPLYSNFPKGHPLYLGGQSERYLQQADLVILAASRAPWYPPQAGPQHATVVAMGETTVKDYMVYQNLFADRYVEGDITLGLGLLVEALQPMADGRRDEIETRRQHWAAEHERLAEATYATEAAASGSRPIDPAWLCAVLSEVMPENVVYSEEVTTHRGAIGRHVVWDRPQSYYKTNGGLGQGLGLALGVKLAKPDQPVVALMGDGGFLYNPVTQCFGVAGEANLPFMTVLFNNQGYEAMRGNHLAYYPDGVAARSDVWHGVDIPGPDYAKLVDPFRRLWRAGGGPCSQLAQALRNGLDGPQ